MPAMPFGSAKKPVSPCGGPDKNRRLFAQERLGDRTLSMETHPISGSGSRFSSALAPDAIGAHVQRPHRILIAEDDVFVGVQYEDVLTQTGYSIIDIVPSAEEAIEATLDHNPELVIMDVRLAGSRDGVEAALEIFK